MAKTARFSFWDKVFAPYFSDLEQWEKVKSSLKFIIKERHKVMHHRPMQLVTISVLSAKEQEITALLGTSKLTLAEPEREQAQHEVEQVLPAYQRARRIRFLHYPLVPDPKRFAHLLPTKEELDRHEQWLQTVVPSSQEIAEMEKHIRSMMPSQEELDRALERIKDAAPKPEEVERARKMLRDAIEENASYVQAARTRNMVLPDPDLAQRIESVQKDIIPIKDTLEQLEQWRKRQGW